jgi:hypothetical protein
MQICLHISFTAALLSLFSIQGTAQTTKQPTDTIAERCIDVSISGFFCGGSKSDNIPWTYGSYERRIKNRPHRAALAA